MEASAVACTSSADDDRPPAKRAKISTTCTATCTGSRAGSAPDGTNTNTTTLPAPVWARSFDFLPYADVRSARLVCRVFANEVPSFIEALNVFRAAEMDVPSATRYGNVMTLNIFCLLREEQGLTVFNCEAAEIVLAFLNGSNFPELKKLFLGGINKAGSPFFYDPTWGGRPANHRVRFRSFLVSLACAFRTRALPTEIDLQCIDNYEYLCTVSEGDENRCICRKIFASFPLRFCFHLQCERCISVANQFEILPKRLDKSLLLDPAFMIDILCNAEMTRSSTGKLHDVVAERMREKCPSLTPSLLATLYGGPANPLLPYYYRGEFLQRVKALVDLGSDPRKVDMSYVMKERRARLKTRSPFVVGKMNLDVLSELGFVGISDDDPNSFVLDEKNHTQKPSILERRAKKLYADFMKQG